MTSNAGQGNAFFRSHIDTAGIITRRTGSLPTRPSHAPRQNHRLCQGIWGYHDLARANTQKLLNLSELEILLTYNAEVRGFLGYYSLADNLTRGEESVLADQYQLLLHTGGQTTKSHLKKVTRSLKKGPGRYVLPSEGKGKPGRNMSWSPPPTTGKGRDQIRPTGPAAQDVDVPKPNGTGETPARQQCEWCGNEEGRWKCTMCASWATCKENAWERQMIQRRRKTMVLCVECHRRASCGHAERSRSESQGKTGEPDTLKRVLSGSEGGSVKPGIAIC